MQPFRRSFAIVIAIVSVGLTAQAAENPLEAVPQDAGVVVRWQKPTETMKKVEEFVTAVDVDLGKKFSEQNGQMGLLISNPELTGVDKSRDWFVAVFPKAEGEPGIVFAIPASDAAAMQEAVGDAFQFAKHDDWLLYSPEAELIEKIQARIAGKEKSISTQIDQRAADVIDRSDVSIFLNVKQLRVVYKEQIDSAEDRMDAELAQLQNFTPPTPGINLQPMLDMYANMFRGMLQGLKDTNGVVVGLAVGKEGVNLETVASVIADSETDKVFAKNKKSALKKLEKLPANSHALIGASGDIGGIVNWGSKLSAAMYTGDEEGKKTLEKATSELAKLEFGTYLMSFGIGDAEGGILRYSNVIDVKPVDKMRELTRQINRGLGKMTIGPVETEIKLKEDAEKYGEKTGDVMTTTTTVDPEQDPLGIQSQMNRIFYGEDGQVLRSVYLKDSVAQTTGGGREAMEKLLKSLAEEQESTGDTAAAEADAFLAVRSKLAPEANVLAMVDLPSLIVDMLQAVIQASQLPIPIDADSLKESISDKRSFLGISVAGEPQKAEVKIHVPFLQVQNMVKLGKAIQQMAAQPQL